MIWLYAFAAGRHLAKHFWAQQLQIHATRIWNAIFSPLRDGLRRHIADSCDLVRAAKHIDDIRIVHTSLKHTLIQHVKHTLMD